MFAFPNVMHLFMNELVGLGACFPFRLAFLALSTVCFSGMSYLLVIFSRSRLASCSVRSAKFISVFLRQFLCQMSIDKDI